MAMQTTEPRHQLTGDWTIAGVVTQVDTLTDSLQKLASEQHTDLHVDCASINSIDMSGLQLLHVWLQCAKMRGIKTRLINLPEDMQKAIHNLGLHQAFSDSYPDAA